MALELVEHFIALNEADDPLRNDLAEVIQDSDHLSEQTLCIGFLFLHAEDQFAVVVCQEKNFAVFFWYDVRIASKLEIAEGL